MLKFLTLAVLTIFFQMSNLFAEDTENSKKVIYIYAGYWGGLFDINNPTANRDNCLEPTYQLREDAAKAGYEVRQTTTLNSLTDFELLIVFDVTSVDQFKELAKYPKEKLVLFLWEPPSVLSQNYNPVNHHYFSRVYTWNDDIVDNKKYFKFYYPPLQPMITESMDFDSKKLCVLISCNKQSGHPNELYSERKKLIEFFERNHSQDFDLYGNAWPSLYTTYKGRVERKVDCLKKYKFACAYENIKGIPGYVTEKIFDCFHAGTVPIYLGASNIEMYIPKKCFVARDDFESDEALYTFLKNMTKEQHNAYVANIQKFLQSGRAQLYSKENFIKIMLDLFKFQTNNEQNK